MFEPEIIQKVRHDSLEADIEAAIENLVHRQKKIDGILFTTNSISLAGAKSLLKHKIDLQKDIQIMCFDESEAFYLLPVSVPFVKQPIEKMAQEAVKRLIRQIEKTPYDNVKQCVMKGELVVEN